MAKPTAAGEGEASLGRNHRRLSTEEGAYLEDFSRKPLLRYDPCAGTEL